MVNLYRMRQLVRQTVKVQWKIERTKAKATKITTVLTGMPRGGSGRNQVEDGAIKLTELREAYDEVIDELDRMREELGPMIDTLDDVNMKAAMRLRYIKGYKPKDIADAISYADRTVYRYLRQAEIELQRRFPDKITVTHLESVSECQ